MKDKEKQRELIVEIMKADEQSGIYPAMKQTAMQLLKESIDYEMKLGTKMVVNWDMYLEMEKQQIKDAFYGEAYSPSICNAEKYYKETYG